MWGTDLNELDISAAKKLSLWIKGVKGGEEFEMHFKDEDGNEAGVDVARYLKVTKDWQELIIPLTDFVKINFNNLRSLTLIFRGKPEEVSGMIYIDDIVFEGKPELLFCSLRDNLRGFPTSLRVRKGDIFGRDDRKLLMDIAKRTWGYFRDIIDTKRHLPLDHIELVPEKKIGDYTSPTNIGLYLISVVSAYQLKFIDKEEALDRINGTLEVIEKLPKWQGLLYNFYSTTNLQIGRRYISSVDNGWFAAGLIITRQAFPEESEKICSKLLKEMDFSALYDKNIGQVCLGYDTEENKLSSYHYGLLVSEARLTSLIAIGKGDIPQEHWFRIYRTLPGEWTWQSQLPQGEWKEYLGNKVLKGYYNYRDIKIVPSWGGSIFEFLMPTLVLKEKELAPDGLGLNDSRAIKGHIDYALKEKGYPVWGISPSSTVDNSYGGYSEFGVTALGSKGYKDDGIITPYASLLAIDFFPRETINNIKQLIKLYNIYGEYGLYDAVDIRTGKVSYRYLSLDQGMILISLNNYLNEGIIRKMFHADEVIKRVEPLLRVEKFF